MSNAIEFYNQGVSHMQNEEHKQADDAFNAAIQLEPAFGEAYHARGIIAALGGDYKRAIADVDEAIRLEPSCAKFYRTRALIYRDIGNENQAQQDMARCRELTAEQS